MITDYFDALFDLHAEANTLSTGSLNEVVKKYQKPIISLLNYKAPAASKYSHYFEEIQKDYRANDLINTFIHPVNETKNFMDSDVLKPSYIYLVDWYTTDLMNIPLPFSYEKQTVKAEDSSISIDEKFKAYASVLMDKGYNVYYKSDYIASQFHSFYRFNQVEDHKIDTAKIRYEPSMLVVEEKNSYSFGINIQADKEIIGTVHTVKINDVLINSTKISSGNLDLDYCGLDLYSTLKDEAMNNSYEACKKAFYEDEVTIKIDDRISIKLTASEIEDTRSLFLMFDILLKMVAVYS